VHLVNNETGVIQPVDRIEVMVGPSPHYLFVDAVQGFGKLALDFSARAPDMMAVSAHKIGGPAGVGALLVKGHADQVRLIPGGGQESGRRGGTEPAALIAGFGAAAEAFPRRYDKAGVGALVAEAEADATGRSRTRCLRRRRGAHRQCLATLPCRGSRTRWR
jgi:cysteine desulfurase